MPVLALITHILDYQSVTVDFYAASHSHLRNADTSLLRLLTVQLQPGIVYRMITDGERIDGRPEHVMAPFSNVVVNTPCHDQDDKKTQLSGHYTQPTFVCLVTEIGEDEDHH
jgi:hypothetical protein